MSLLTDSEIEDLYFTEVDNRIMSFARAIEASVIKKLATVSVELPEAVAQQDADAKRYRWLRLGSPYTVTISTPTEKKPNGKTHLLHAPNHEYGYGEALDAAIDAAMKEQQ